MVQNKDYELIIFTRSTYTAMKKGDVIPYILKERSHLKDLLILKVDYAPKMLLETKLATLKNG